MLSSYNGGPGGNIWANNPACGSKLDCNIGEERFIYDTSRPIEGIADWNTISPENYPYQERVLNNLPFARRLKQHQIGGIREWMAAGLRFQAITRLVDTGMRPEDTVFVRINPLTGQRTSFAPNLLLFRHRAASLLPDLNAQTVFFEYDLPFSAQVTITLALSDGTERPLCSQSGVAGWNRLFCRANVPLAEGDAYRLRAERGSPDEPASYYLGQFLQYFSFTDGPQQVQMPSHSVYLPLIQSTGQPIALLNRNFILEDPLEGWKPDYWDVQALFSNHPISGLPEVSEQIGRSEQPRGWQIMAAPGAIVDMRQRITLEPGRYLLRVQLDVAAADAESVLSIRTRPAEPGAQPWSLVTNIAAEVTGPQINQYQIELDGPTTISLLASFGPEDEQSVFILRSVELFQ